MSVKDKFSWLDGENIRPYVYVRPENNITLPGKHFSIDWFPGKPIFKNPLRMGEVDFANQILRLEGHVFASSQMAMPRWVFFDCAIIPGFVAGFAIKTRLLPKPLRDLMQPDPDSEWSPLSLFIIIPSMCAQEWVAHNLSSANAALPDDQRYYGLGFLSKAFGLWYANVEVCCGVTQWQGHALRLHSHFGALEILTAYTPVHSIAETLAYRLRTDPSYWPHFFDGQPVGNFKQKFQPAGLTVEPGQKQSLIALQQRIEAGDGPFYLDGNEIRRTSNGPLTVYTPK
jgi:hypothetical protein